MSTRKLNLVLVALMIATMLLAACGRAPPPDRGPGCG